MQSQISSGGKTPSKVQVLHDFVFPANQNAKQVKRETKSLDPITEQTRHNSKAMTILLMHVTSEFWVVPVLRGASGPLLSFKN